MPKHVDHLVALTYDWTTNKGRINICDTLGLKGNHTKLMKEADMFAERLIQKTWSMTLTALRNVINTGQGKAMALFAQRRKFGVHGLYEKVHIRQNNFEEVHAQIQLASDGNLDPAYHRSLGGVIENNRLRKAYGYKKVNQMVR